jgi:tetratricopeptide (TPR) repeat protein
MTLAVAACVVAGGLAAVRGVDDPAAPVALPPGAAVRANVDAVAGATASARAIASLEAAVAARPDDADPAARLGLAYLQRARESSDPTWYLKADDLLRRARELDPASLDAVLGLGSLALSRHEFAKALGLGGEALQLSDGFSPAALAIVADAQIELGRYDEAFASIERLGEMHPSLVAYARQSYASELQGDLDAAIDLMATASRAAAGESGIFTRVELAALLVRAGRLDDAEHALRGVLAKSPADARIEAGLGEVAVARGDLVEAARWYERASLHLPLPEVLVALGDVQSALGRSAAAKASYALVEAQHDLFRTAGGDADLEVALFAADHGDPAEAVALARRVVRDRPSVQAHDALAWSLFRAGDCAAALAAARKATALRSVLPLLDYHHGVIAACAGERREAIRALRRATVGSPNFHPLFGPAAAGLLTELEES